MLLPVCSPGPADLQIPMITKYRGVTLAAILFCASQFSGCTQDADSVSDNSSIISSSDGNSIFYRVHGEGEPSILFVHCWTCNHTFWNAQAEYFSKNHQVIVPDLAGHGMSSQDREQYSMTAFAADVAAVVKAVEARQIILVGHSMGAPVVLEAADLLGDRVIGLVAVDTFHTPFQYPSSREKINNIVDGFRGDFKTSQAQYVRSLFAAQVEDNLIDSIVSQMTAVDENVALSALYEIFLWHLTRGEEYLRRYAGKLRHINSTALGVEKPGHDSVLIVPGTGHFIAQEKPSEFNQDLEQIITDFIAAL